MSQILFVDDEPAILSAASHIFSQHDMEILTARSAEEALGLMECRKIAVIVADQRMPGMSGCELLERARHLSPETVRILLSGFTDIPPLLDAINNGKIFRFILKPWNNDELIQHIDEALEQFSLNLKYQRQEEQMLLTLAQTIELKDRYTKGHCERVARYAVEVARELGLREDHIRDIRYGAWLHDCGKIGLHEDILNHPGPISAQQMEEVRKHPDNGVRIAEQAGFPPRVINIIRFHHERVDGSGYPLGLNQESIPLEAKIVAVADIYDVVTSDRPYRKACSPRQVEQIMLGYRGCVLDGELVELLMSRVIPRLQAEEDGQESAPGSGRLRSD